MVKYFFIGWIVLGLVACNNSKQTANSQAHSQSAQSPQEEKMKVLHEEKLRAREEAPPQEAAPKPGTVSQMISNLAADQGPETKTVGTLKNLAGAEGCNWVIDVNSGRYLVPDNLDKFRISRKDGARLKLTYREDPEKAVSCQSGISVHISEAVSLD